jgi:hypothetical protein
MRKIITSVVLLFAANICFAQLKGLGEKLIKGKDPLSALTKKAPITTSLEDVNFEGSLDPEFGNDSVYAPMLNLQRTPNVGFVLQRGFYRYQVQSYCLKAGTHGPGGGDGYMYAPPKGPMDEIVMTIVRNSVNKPELQQQDIQVLLWSIIARAKFEDMQTKLKLVAAQLLTPRQLAKLNGGALGLIPDAATQKALDAAPAPLKAVLEAEQKLRQMVTSASATYQEMETVAILSGNAPFGPGSREVPSGRWSLHPDGYYVRYIPSSYSSTRMEIWVPQGSPAVGKEYDPATHIAVP